MGWGNYFSTGVIYSKFSNSIISNALDSSLNGIELNSSGHSIKIDGKLNHNNGVYFDGIDTYLANETLTSSDFDIYTGEFTLSAWFKPFLTKHTKSR